LKGSSHYGIIFNGDTNETINYQLYSDASFANSDDKRKSVTGYVALMAHGPISYRSVRQDNITISTMEAELVACSEACRESEWIRILLSELGFSVTKPTIVYCDNTSVVAIAKNPGNHNGTKHIDIRHLYIRELVERNRVSVTYCWTENMIADILTKAVPTKLFTKLRHLIGVRSIQMNN